MTGDPTIDQLRAAYSKLSRHLREQPPAGHAVAALSLPIGPMASLMACHQRLHPEDDRGRVHVDPAYHQSLHDTGDQ